MSDEHITTSCPSCGARLKVSPHAAGKRARCPRCQNAFVVAEPAAPEPISASSALDENLLVGLAGGTPVESAEARRARYEAIAAQAARAGRGFSGPEAAEETTPRRRFNLGAWLVSFGRAFVPIEPAGRFCFGMIVLGGALFGFGLKSAAVRSRWRTQPQVISCVELLARGPGDNLHVVLTDFVLLPEYVYEQKLNKWQGAWVPAVPRATLDAAIARILKVDAATVRTLSEEQIDKALKQVKGADFAVHLVVYLPDADGKAYVERIMDAGTLQGTLLSDHGLGQLSREKRKLLASSYPRAELEHCWVLQEGRAPIALATASAYQFGGGGLVLLALVVAGRRASRAWG